MITEQTHIYVYVKKGPAGLCASFLFIKVDTT